MSAASEGDRYDRQRLLGFVGVEGQARLGRSRVVIVGCGALGTVAAEALARAGVGTLVIVDRDVVERSNLQRQTLFDTRDAQEEAPKAVAAARRLKAINPECAVVPVIADVSGAGAERVLEVGWAVARARAEGTLTDEVAVEDGVLVDAVVDATDNFETRFLLNDVCVKHGVPLVYGGAVGTVGTLMTVMPGEGACLRCVFPSAPAAGTSPTCDTVGVLGPIAGVIGNVQAGECMKILLGRRDAVVRAVRSVDLWTGVMRAVDLSDARDPGCACCAGRRFSWLEGAEVGAVSLCGAGAVQIGASAGTWLDLGDVRARLARVGSAELGRYFVRASPSGSGVELTVFRDGRAIVRGTEDVARARAVYSRYVGG